MKLKSTFVMTEIGDSVIAVPIGRQDSDSRCVIRLNETAADIWSGIEQEKSFDRIADDLLEKYDGIDKAEALEYVKAIVSTLIEAGIAEK